MIKRSLASLAMVLIVAMSAKAELILDFAQTGTANTTVITSTGGTSTTITNTNTIVSIDAIDSAIVTPFSAFYDFSAHLDRACDPRRRSSHATLLGDIFVHQRD